MSIELIGNVITEAFDALEDIFPSKYPEDYSHPAHDTFSERLSKSEEIPFFESCIMQPCGYYFILSNEEEDIFIFHQTHDLKLPYVEQTSGFCFTKAYPINADQAECFAALNTLLDLASKESVIGDNATIPNGFYPSQLDTMINNFGKAVWLYQTINKIQTWGVF